MFVKIETRPIDGSLLEPGDIVVLAGEARRVTWADRGHVTVKNSTGDTDTFPVDYFGPTWECAYV